MTGRGTGADTILFGGPVYTMEQSAPSDAVSIKDGRIVAVGSDASSEWRATETNLVNLHGRPVFPGFQDAHIHPTGGGLERMRCDLSELHCREQYLDAISEYAAAHPKDDWIRGAGWYGDVFDGGFPHRELLDAIEPNRPVILASHDGHGVWVNSEALRRAGITRDTADPAGGRIQRESGGEPSGMLMESAADLVTDLLPAPSEADIDEALLRTQSYLHSLGITAWQDAAVGEAIGIPDAFDAYLRLAGDGRLTAKVTGALWWDRDAEPDEQLATLNRRRDRAAMNGGTFRATAVKIMQDGVCENLTGSMLEPYRDQGENSGLSFLQPAELSRLVERLDGSRFDVHIHAVGDRAVRESVDAIESIGRREWDSRHQITHIDVVDRAEITRMANLHIIANLQPLWARRDKVLVSTKLPYLTDDQQSRHFAFRSILDAGIDLAFSSDWPVSSPNPLWGIHVAANRTAPPNDPHAQDPHAQSVPLMKAEAIGVAEALAAYTSGAARANRMETQSGTLRVGNAADLIVLAKDPFTVPTDELGTLSVMRTMVDGVTVYSCE